MDGLIFIKGAAIDIDAEINNGSVVLLEFWATWCPPCRSSIPHVTEIQKKFGKDLIVVGITKEQESRAKPFVDSMGAEMDYLVVVDSKTEASKKYMEAYNVRGIPHAFLLSGGKVYWHGHPMEDELEAKIQECIQAKK